MTVVTVLHGFKVPLPVLDAFLLANNIYESECLCAGYPPFYDEEDDEVTTLLRNKVGSGDAKTRVFLPTLEGYKRPTCCYIAYDWTIVYAQRRFDVEDLAERPPCKHYCSPATYLHISSFFFFFFFFLKKKKKIQRRQDSGIGSRTDVNISGLRGAEEGSAIVRHRQRRG
jgi:hypothetical protein